MALFKKKEQKADTPEVELTKCDACDECDIEEGDEEDICTCSLTGKNVSQYYDESSTPRWCPKAVESKAGARSDGTGSSAGGAGAKGKNNVFKTNDDENTKNINQLAKESFRDIAGAISGAKYRIDRKIPDNIIAFTGAAGGVGTSTVLANVAKQLSMGDRSVLVVDFNVLFPIQHVYLNCPIDEMNFDMLDFLSGNVKMDKVIKNIGDLAIMLSIGRNIMDFESVDTQKTAEFWEETLDKLRDLFDIILIDVPHGMVSSALINMTLYKADRVYVVWDENVSCIANTEQLQNSLAVTGIDLFMKTRLIFNKKTSIKYDSFPIKTLKLRLVTTLPFEIDVITSGLEGEIFITSGQSGSKNAAVFAQRIADIAQHMLDDSGYRPVKGRGKE